MDIHGFLANIWLGLCGLMLVLYVVLDGFDLGVGILTLFTRDEERQGIMMNCLGSVWDANETWLVVLGGALFGAFPVVYSVVLSGLYVPFMITLFGLIFRAVAFEFRENARRKFFWDGVFGVGSLAAAVSEGYVLGAIIAGMPVKGGEFAGTTMGWFSPFSTIVAVGVVFGYVLLGATYLIVKTIGPLQAWNYRVAVIAAWLTVAVGVVVSVLTPIYHPYIADKWFSGGITGFMVLPAAAGIAFLLLLRSLHLRHEHAPFVWSLFIFMTSLLGLAGSLYPRIVPPGLLVESAAADSNTLIFMLTGVGMLLPVMLIYNAYQYLTFRGKVTHAHYGDTE